MTKIKAISAVAAAVVLTSFGAMSAYAWNYTLSATFDCTNGVVVKADDKDGSLRKAGSGDAIFTSGATKVTKTWHIDKSGGENQNIVTLGPGDLAPGTWTIYLAVDKSITTTVEVKTCAPTCPAKALTVGTPTVVDTTLTWTVHNPNSVVVNFGYVLNDDLTVHSSSAPANGDAPGISVAVIAGVNKIVVAPIVGDFVCQPTIATFTYTPRASASPTATATASPTSTVAPTSTAVPSPPATGSGPNGSHDNSFGIVLLVLVVGTGIAGGTTLALSRKGN